jgi:penicillin amidase
MGERGRCLRRRLAWPVLTLALCACAALPPRSVTTAERIAAFPTAGLPLEQAVTVRWNRYGVPWIEARTDRDLAFTLGLIHAHLRLGQMALAKRIVQGRLSESAGPSTHDIDRLLRTIDFDYASAGSESRMSPDTHAWMQAFVEGLNWYQQHAARRPPEYGLLGLRDEPWTIADLLAIGRLAGTDVNWLADAQLLQARLKPGWPQVWQRALAAGTDSPMSFGSNEAASLLSSLLARSGHSGSDALAVAPGHSKSGAALLASDPHLGLTLPNFWILVGLKSPGYHAVGLMPPGLPIIGLGRNDDVAWSGTNMHAAASDLYDVSGEPAALASRQERLRTRLWFDSEVTVRRAPAGPIVSDTSFFPARPGETIALHWTGHEPSDEIGAFLGAMRAKTAGEFRAALAGYSVGGENMLCATRTGDICQVMAVHLPIREPGLPADLVRRVDDPAARWRGEAGALDLPWALNPPAGLLASANNRPTLTAFPVGYFFQTAERIERLRALLSAKEKLSLDDLDALVQDTLSISALELKTALAAEIRKAGVAGAQPEFIRTLESWDGRYDAAQPGPVAFEMLLYEVAQRLYAGEDGKVPSVKSDWNYLIHYLRADLAARPEQERTTLIGAAMQAAARSAPRYPRWGDMHRMRVGHALADVPLIGGFFVLDDYGVGGSRNTIMKTAHGLVDGRHDASYGSQARQLCDMSDPDLNRFVLFGGEDGWLGSANFADQVELWRAGRTITMPLTAQAVAEQFPMVLRLVPHR